MKHKIQFRVRYSETDKMGYVYYGNYAQYFEMGRVEWMRNVGVSYRELENSGILLPVKDFTVRYLKPAFYDDLLTLETTLLKKPTAKIEFNYQLFREKELLTEGYTLLVFIDAKTKKTSRSPAELQNLL